MSLYGIVLCKVDACSCKKAGLKVSKDSWDNSGWENRGLHCMYGVS